MLLPSLGSVVHVVVAQRIFHELSYLFHHTVMSLKFSDRQIWANIVNPNQTAPDRGLRCLSFRVHLSSALVKPNYSKFKIITSMISCVKCFHLDHGRTSAEYTIGICLERDKKTENSK